MILKLHTIRDIKTGLYNVPVVAHTHGEAERTFSKMTKDSNSTISQNPEDFDLYYLGDYDNQTGELTPLKSPQHICNAMSLKERQPASMI